jgi:hypothetical protein
MSNLRIVGLIVGIFGLFLTFRIFRGPRWKRGNFIVFGIFSLFLITISVDPNVLNTVAEILKLDTRQRGRVLALLIGSNISLWFILFYFKSKLDEYKYQFGLLVQSLGYEDVKTKIKDKIRDRQIMILIPAYNEAESLKELLKQIPRQIESKKVGVLVIDDGSYDNTNQIVAQTEYLYIRNKIKRGGGAALVLGYSILKNIKPEICVTMDADGQHSPEEIGELVKPILENKYDFVIGSRILGKREKGSIFRFIGLHVFNMVIRLLTGIKITDCSSGFRAFRADLLDKIVLTEEQYHTSELIIDAAKKSFRIGEVPVTISKRRYGSSKKGKDWKYGLNFAKTILKTWWR